MSATWGKRLLTLFSILATAGSMTWWSGRGVAAGQTALAQGAMHVRLCVSLPFTSPDGAIAQGIYNAVILATEQWQARLRVLHLDLLPPLRLDDAGPSIYDSTLEKLNARSCVGRSDVFGYVGPLNSGATLISEPILNRAALLQINPSNTNPGLTSPNPLIRKALEPATYSHRLVYPTYFRVVTTDAMQGPADAGFIRKRLGARDYFSVDNPGNYESGLSGAAQAYATRIGLRLVGTAHLDPSSPSSTVASSKAVAEVVAAKQPEALFCACGYASEAAAFVSALRRRGYAGPFIGPDAIITPDFINGAGSGAANSYASNVGLDATGASAAFRSAYRRRFHAPLQLYDAFGYDAAGIALHAIYQATMSGTLHGSLYQMRAAILPYVARVRWHGATGTTTFDRNGDTTNRVASLYTVRNGVWRFVGASPPVKGVSPTG